MEEVQERCDQQAQIATQTDKALVWRERREASLQRQYIKEHRRYSAQRFLLVVVIRQQIPLKASPYVVAYHRDDASHAQYSC